MPVVPNQRWSCRSCGNCCRTLVGHLFEREREQIDDQGWADELGVAPYVRVGRGWALNKRPDGACVFLDQDNRCEIHAKYGEKAKPLACRIFPFSVRAVRGGWQASLRFDCPSMASSLGKPIGQYRVWLSDLVGQLDHDPPSDEDVADLQRGIRATVDEIDIVITRFVRWVKDDDLPVANRLIGAARITAELSGATLRKVRGRRFGELLDVLFQALPSECEASLLPATGRQRATLRQLAFAHAEHVSLAEMRFGFLRKLGKRWQQLGKAKRFRAGRGTVPALPGIGGSATFEAVESVRPAAEPAEKIEDMLCRYVSARLRGRSVFGRGYYNWPVCTGMAALWLSIAAAGWLARYLATTGGNDALSFDELACALGLVDRAATRSPALGTLAERARVAYLLGDDGVARLVNSYRPL